jgi:hypothetical protein
MKNFSHTHKSKSKSKNRFTRTVSQQDLRRRSYAAPSLPGLRPIEGDLRKFKIACPKDPNVFVIINTHVDHGGAILTLRSKYDETLQVLRDRYPGSLDSTTMDRYLGMGFSYNSDTGVQQAPYTIDLFDPSDDLTPATLLSLCILPLEVVNFPSHFALAPTQRSRSTRLTPNTMRSNRY